MIVLLLSPAQQSTQDHLTQLAAIARYFSQPDTLDDLLACRALN
nr:PTS sugar transporter subunit IIA [Petrachloros mirabilis]